MSGKGRETSGQKQQKNSKRGGWLLWLTAAVTLLLGWALLALPGTVSKGILSGLRACGGVIIPSLFPFMVLSGFVTLSPVGELLSRPLTLITTKMLRLPRQLGGVVLMSFIGGYPVGARAISNLLRQGRISPQTAARMMVSCVNPGPSFVIGAVGLLVLGSPQAGAAVFAAQAVSALLLGWLFARRAKDEPPPALQTADYPPLPVAFVEAVRGAAMAMVVICGFVLLFSAVIALLNADGMLGRLSGWVSAATLGLIPADAFSCALAGMLEVTYGTLLCGVLPPQTARLLVPFLLAFGSVSVICQVAACFDGQKINLRPFVLSRFLHGLLTAVIAQPLLGLVPKTASVFLPGDRPLPYTTPATMPATLLLVAMASMLLLSCADKKGSRSASK